jgi:hypothetical protein
MTQTGMRRQLVTLKQLTQLMIPKLYTHLEKSRSDEFFFLFRQLLVWFKREFSWEDVCRLWECLWTDWLSGQFHLFIALAILDRHKEVIMGMDPPPPSPPGKSFTHCWHCCELTSFQPVCFLLTVSPFPSISLFFDYLCFLLEFSSIIFFI